MRSTRRLLPLTGALAVLFALSACDRNAAYRRFDAPWVHFLTGEGLVGAYDSAHVVARGDTVDVHLRFQYAHPQHVGRDSTRVFTATEVYETVHCPSRRVRDIRMLVRDSAGDSLAGYTTAAPAWQSFADHPLSDRVLVRLCNALARRRDAR